MRASRWATRDAAWTRRPSAESSSPSLPSATTATVSGSQPCARSFTTTVAPSTSRAHRGVGSRFEVWLPCTPLTALSAGEEGLTLSLGCGETLAVIESDRELLLRHEDMLAAL